MVCVDILSRAQQAHLHDLLVWALDGEPLTTREERVAEGEVVLRTCAGCDGTFEAPRRRGRPPTYCDGCRSVKPSERGVRSGLGE